MPITRDIHDSGPLYAAWKDHKSSAAYKHALACCAGVENPEGLLWGQFETGFAYGTAHARSQAHQERMSNELDH